MRVEIVGKNGFEFHERTEELVRKRLQKIENFFKDGVIDTARVVLKKYNTYYACEITIPVKGLIFRSEVKDKDFKAAIDIACDKLLSQVRRRKDRVKNKLEKEGIKEVYRNNQFDMDDISTDVFAGSLVKNKKIDLKPMTVEEALDQMELLGHDFFVFQDAASHNVCVVYTRDVGNYAIIETSEN